MLSRIIVAIINYQPSKSHNRCPTAGLGVIAEIQEIQRHDPHLIKELRVLLQKFFSKDFKDPDVVEQSERDQDYENHSSGIRMAFEIIDQEDENYEQHQVLVDQ